MRFVNLVLLFFILPLTSCSQFQSDWQRARKQISSASQGDSISSEVFSAVEKSDQLIFGALEGGRDFLYQYPEVRSFANSAMRTVEDYGFDTTRGVERRYPKISKLFRTGYSEFEKSLDLLSETNLSDAFRSGSIQSVKGKINNQLSPIKRDKKRFSHREFS